MPAKKKAAPAATEAPKTEANPKAQRKAAKRAAAEANWALNRGDRERAAAELAAKQAALIDGTEPSPRMAALLADHKRMGAR